MLPRRQSLVCTSIICLPFICCLLVFSRANFVGKSKSSGIRGVYGPAVELTTQQQAERKLLARLSGAADQTSLRSGEAHSTSSPCPPGFVFKLIKQEGEQTSAITKGLDGSFECIARAAGTDKVNPHNYMYIYSKYLQHVRQEPLRMLEIGLGCCMPMGPGRSFEAWRRYLPRASISYLELNASCAEAFRPAVEATGGRLYVGSQNDTALLQHVVREAQGVDEGAAGQQEQRQHHQQQYDLIVDDGKHDPHLQLRTLRGLWGALRPGGMYVVEDVQLQYIKHGQLKASGGSTAASAGGEPTFMAWVRTLPDLVQCRGPSRNLYHPEVKAHCRAASELELSVLSVECMTEACVLVKHPRPTMPRAW